MNWDVISGVIRHILTFGGGYAVARGWADEATMQTVIAGLVAGIGVFWSAMVKTRP
jgi:hypothetical protein